MIEIYNNNLEQLIFAISAYQGEFALLGVECETRIQGSFSSYFQQISPIPVKSLKLNPTDKLLLNTLLNKLAELEPKCVIVEGLDQVDKLDEMLIAANFVRDEFRKKFSFPLILLFSQETWIKLFRLASHFESWMIKEKIETNSSI